MPSLSASPVSSPQPSHPAPDVGSGGIGAPPARPHPLVRLLVITVTAVTVTLLGVMALMARDDDPQADTTVSEAPAFPTASTTGVPAGTALKASGSVTVSTAGAVVEGLDVRGTVHINASNVTLRKSRITGADWVMVRIKEGVTGVRIEDVEVNGSGFSGQPGSVGIQGPATVVRANIHRVENGVIPSSGGVVRDSFIHTLEASGADPHYDGVQLDGGQRNVVIQHNTVDLTNQDRTSTVMINNDFGSIDTVNVTGNRLLGGSFTVYSDGKFDGGAITGVSFTNNRMGKGGYGYGLIRENTVTWTGNIDDASGREVGP